MHTNRVENFERFVDRCLGHDLVYHQTVFRGQPVKGNLLPAVAREHPWRDTTKQEKEQLDELKISGAPFAPQSQESDLDLLVRAQHFGLRTRLLDWTTNPLAALWFACSDRAAGDVFVYALATDDLMIDREIYTSGPFSAEFTRVLRPTLSNPRVIAQYGWFTLHRYSQSSKAFVPLEKNPDTLRYLHEYLIPKEARPYMMSALDRFGVNARTLLPDFGGLCQYLNWKADSNPILDP